ncbi:MAG: hypothetical protein HY821_01225 [Acidobacteria bacterium]|nr:hypothetical protein [Acidobacteriota bacterium]
MSVSWLSVIALVLSLATLAAIGAGSPHPGSLGPNAVEALGAVALQLQFGGLVLLALITGRWWKSSNSTFVDGGWPSLRSLAMSAPVFTLAQIALGAAYRYKLVGVIPHVAWAFVAAIVLLMFGAFVLVQADAAMSLKRMAGVLISLVCVQVMLGVAALLARVARLEKARWMEISTTAHLMTGALVLGCSLVLAAFVVRSAQPAQEGSQLATPGSPS